MEESDEDIDPLVGPVADLMAEHNLSSTTKTTTDIENPVKSIEILDKRINLLDYLSFFNIHSLFKDIVNYFLDIQWCHYLAQISPKIEQEVFLNQSQIHLSVKKLSLFFIVSPLDLYFPSDFFSFSDLCNPNLIISIYISHFIFYLHSISSYH
jgi:hypothetical protein